MADINSINKGDKVRFLNEKGEGKVSRIEKKYVYVLVEDGFEIPVLPNEIIIVEKADNSVDTAHKQNTGFQVNYNYADREDDFFADKELDTSEKELLNEIYIAFVKKALDIEIYIVNPGDYFTYYHVSSASAFIDAGKLEPGMQALIDTKEQAKTWDWKTINVQCIVFHPRQKENLKVIDKSIKIETLLMQQEIYAENDFFDESAAILNLCEKNVQIPEIRVPAEKILAEKEAEPEDISKRFHKRPEKETVEVDLHIEKLLDNFAGMSNHEMLTFQLNHFRKELESALKNKDKISRIVFIHGIGNGTLKLQLRKQLDDVYSFLYYQDASFAEYGFGATMVMLDRMRR